MSGPGARLASVFVVGGLCAPFLSGDDASAHRNAGDVVMAFLRQANTGACQDARRLFLPAALEYIESEHGTFEAYCTKRTRNRTISKTEIKGAWPHGSDRIEVRVWTHYLDGLTIHTEYLERVEGAWRISWVGAAWANALQRDRDWASLAAIAERSGRKADAWVFYRLAERQRGGDAAVRREIDRLWKELGGSEEGRSYLRLLDGEVRKPQNRTQ